MPVAVRLSDIGSGHGSFPPTVTISASPNTFINSKAVHRKGDALAPHGSPSPSPPHGRATSGGSSKTFVNSKAIARLADGIACGGVLVTGSPDTIIDEL